MRTNIEIDDKLMRDAMKLSGAKTKKAVVEDALQLLVRARKQERSLERMFGALKGEKSFEKAPGKDKWKEAEERYAAEDRAAPKEGRVTIVESSVWIDVLYGRQSAHAEWVRHNRPLVALTDLILTETLQGIRSDSVYIATHEDLLHFPVLDCGGTNIAVASAQNYRALRKRGITIRSTIDCMTATFCIAQGHSLLHNDRDFHPFERHFGLKVVHP